jgi:sulfatase-like protein
MALPSPSRSSVVAWPFYPAALCAWYVLSLWLNSSLDVPTLLRPLAIAAALGLAVTIVAVAATRDVNLGGVVAGLVVLGLLGGDDSTVILLTALGLIVLVLLAWRAPTLGRLVRSPRLTSVLNVFAACLLIVLIATAGSQLLVGGGGSRAPLAVANQGSRSLPSIVVLLLDAHGRQDVLADDYGEDISGFVSSLESRGFHVSSHSRSNYMSTQMTLASMLNLRHLSELGLPSQTDPAYLAGLRTRIEGNAAFDMLRSVGYGVESVSPGYEGVALRSADVSLDGGQVSELESAVLANSVAWQGLSAVAPDALADQMRERVRWNLEPDHWLPQFEAMTGDGRPGLLFVHVPSPHPPYLFDRDGDRVLGRPVLVPESQALPDLDEDSVAATAAAYAGQLEYVDSLTISALDKVIEAVPDDAVIVVMSDHGPDAHLDWSHLTTANSTERFENFFAARTPGFDGLFGDSPTPVNVFRALLNAYAGSQLPLEANSSFLGYPPAKALVDIGNPEAAGN